MSAEATASTPPPTVQSHDPIPEANWFWRRLFSFIFIAIMLAGMWGIGFEMRELAGANGPAVIDKLYGMFRYMTLLTFVSTTYYMVAPSAEQVTRMWQTASMFKSGIVSQVTQTATAADGSRATSVTTTGQNPAPPVVVVPVSDAPLPPPPENAPWH